MGPVNEHVSVIWGIGNVILRGGEKKHYNYYKYSVVTTSSV